MEQAARKEAARLEKEKDALRHNRELRDRQRAEDM
jgi:hypothetical protein